METLHAGRPSALIERDGAGGNGGTPSAGRERVMGDQGIALPIRLAEADGTGHGVCILGRFADQVTGQAVSALDAGFVDVGGHDITPWLCPPILALGRC